MLRDDSFPPITMSFPNAESSPPPSPPPSNYNASNSLDDIFGSAPPSPTFPSVSSPRSHPSEPANYSTEPSEIPRLRSEHSTAGYRDGLSIAKGKHVQDGFDEGFSLGAVLGLRVGEILGVLEGILGAFGNAKTGAHSKSERTAHGEEEAAKTGDESVDYEPERLKALVEQARKELMTEEVFGREWWGEDGIWKFEVVGEEGEVTFKEVADAHPLLKRWDAVVDTEVKRFGLDLSLLEGDEGRDLEG